MPWESMSRQATLFAGEANSMNMVIRQVGSQVHILVPWHDVHHEDSIASHLWKGLGLENAPAVFMPIYKG